jgi:hypothetical protein
VNTCQQTHALISKISHDVSLFERKKSDGSKNLYLLWVVARRGSEWASGKDTSKQNSVCVCTKYACFYPLTDRTDLSSV